MLYKHLKPYLKHYFRFIAVILILSVLFAAAQFFYPILLSKLIDNIEKSTSFSLKNQGFWLLIVLIGKSVTDFLLNWLKLRLTRHFNLTEYPKLYERFFKVRYEKIRQEEPTYFINRFDTYLFNIRHLMESTIPNFILSVMTAGLSLGIAVTIHWLPGVLLMLILPIQVTAYYFINQKLARDAKHLQETSARTYSGIVNLVMNIESIKQLNHPAFFAKMIHQNMLENQQCQYQINHFANLACTIFDGVIDLLNGAALFITVCLCFTGQLSLASVFLFFQIRSIYGEEVKKLVSMNLNLRDLKPAVSFIETAIDAHLEKDEGQSLEKIDTITVQIDHFGFGSKPVFEHLNMNIPVKEWVGLIGPSGSGKSTLVKMLVRLYENEQIFINGVPVSHYHYQSIRSKIYLLSQKAELFLGTIRENLTCGLDNVSEEKLNSVLSLKCFQPLLCLQDGLDTQVKEEASNLSGGQRQLAALARMMLHDPEVIIFDESFSAMDESLEKAIWQDLESFLQGRTVIVIAHRPSSLERCRQLLYLKPQVSFEENKKDNHSSSSDSLKA